MEFNFETFLDELKQSPSYVKDNVMCYFYHNTSACSNCPKQDCKGREPRELPPKITDLDIDPTEKNEYLVRICDYYTIAIPNPKTNYTLFCDIIRRIGRGEYKKLFFPKEAPILDKQQLDEFRKEMMGTIVSDKTLPKFCIAHHCTKRGPKCDKCAYTAFSSSHRRRLEA